MKRTRTSKNKYREWMKESYTSVYAAAERIAEYIPDPHANERAHFSSSGKKSTWNVWKQLHDELQSITLAAAEQEEWRSLSSYLSSSEGNYEGQVAIEQQLRDFALFFPLYSVLSIYIYPRNLFLLYLKLSIKQPLTIIEQLPENLRPELKLRHPCNLPSITNIIQYRLIKGVDTFIADEAHTIELYIQKLCSKGQFSSQRAEVLQAILRDYHSVGGNSSKLAADAYMYCLTHNKTVPDIIRELVREFPSCKIADQILVGTAPAEKTNLAREISWASSATECLFCSLLARDFEAATLIIKQNTLKPILVSCVLFRALTSEIYSYATAMGYGWDLKSLIHQLKSHSWDWRAQSPSDSLSVLMSCGGKSRKENILSLAGELINTFALNDQRIVSFFLERGIRASTLLAAAPVKCVSLPSFLKSGIRVPLDQLPLLDDYAAPDVLTCSLYSPRERATLLQDCSANLDIHYVRSILKQKIKDAKELETILAVLEERS